MVKKFLIPVLLFYHFGNAADLPLSFEEDDDQDKLPIAEVATMPDQKTLERLFLEHKLQHFAEKTLVIYQLADMYLSAEVLEIIEGLSLSDYSDVLKETMLSDGGNGALEDTKILFDDVIEILLKDFPEVKKQRDLLKSEKQKNHGKINESNGIVL